MFTVTAVAVVAIIIIIYIIFRYMFGFWIRQPVFHCYDLSYYLYPNKVIDPELPAKNKFTNFLDIQTYLMDEMTEPLWATFIEFIQNNFLKNKNNEFHPKLENVLPYFKNATKSMFSFYTEKTKEAPVPTTISVMTSRPVNSILKGITLPLYYVDYLCVKKSHRKKGIAEQMIQTHHYNQRRLNKNIQVSLFKREGELTGIVPLTCYDCYGYFLDKIFSRIGFKVNDKYSVVEIGKTNMHILTDYMKKPETMSRFEVFIYDNYSSVLETIATNNMYIYGVISRETQEILSFYGFKRSCVTINGKEILTCYFSLRSPGTSDELFYYCFLDAIKSINKKLTLPYKLIAVENITDNQGLIRNIEKVCRPFVRSPTAYFLYNYVCIPVKSNKCVILL
jgi:hypothetical protein